MHARFQFDEKKVGEMPLTITFTTTFEQWQKIAEALEATGAGSFRTAVGSLHECVKQLVAAVDDATGHGYRTSAYTYTYKTDAETAAEKERK
jgi:hypothetical protein